MVGNKFILEGDEINPNNEPDEKGEETREWITAVVHDPVDRQTDGRWDETITQEKVPVREIRWAGLYDKNSNKLYAPKQLLPQNEYDMRHKEIFERHVSKYRNYLLGQKEGIKMKYLSFEMFKNSFSQDSTF